MRYFFGPEIIWLLLYGILKLPAQLTWNISNGFDNILESLWFYIPVIALFIFILWWIPVVEKNWLLTRVWITNFIGGLYIFEHIMDTYGKSGSGVGTAYIVCAMLLILALVIGTIIVKLKF